MCDAGPPIEHVRLVPCGHGNLHLYLGKQTLHLTPRELGIIGSVISRWLRQHPSLLRELEAEGLCIGEEEGP